MTTIGASTRTHRAAPAAVREPSIGWYRAAGLLAAAGFVVVAAWVFATLVGLTGQVDFDRTRVPGQVSTPIDDTGTYYVYSQGAGDLTLAQLGVAVTDPSGRRPVAVQPVNGTLRYGIPGRVGHAVGRFQATTTGTYRLTVTGDEPGATVGVGDRVANRVLPALIGTGVLLVLMTCGGPLIALFGSLHRSRLG